MNIFSILYNRSNYHIRKNNILLKNLKIIKHILFPLKSNMETVDCDP